MAPFGKVLAYAAVASVASLAFAQPQQKSDFERAVEKAGEDARANGDADASARAERDANATRADAGVGHDGRASVSDGVSVGGSVSEGGAEVNVRADLDPK